MATKPRALGLQMPAGRPTDYREEYAAEAKKLARLGATDDEIADFFNVSTRTVYRWKNTQEAFRQALKAGKDEADDRVERALFHRAIGYEQDAVKIFMPTGADQPVYAKYVEKITPDTTAAIFWLKNRRPEQWRDRQITEVTGKDGGPIQSQDVPASQRLLDRLAHIEARLAPPKSE